MPLSVMLPVGYFSFLRIVPSSFRLDMALCHLGVFRLSHRCLSDGRAGDSVVLAAADDAGNRVIVFRGESHLTNLSFKTRYTDY